jgi:hypothetical protein
VAFEARRSKINFWGCDINPVTYHQNDVTRHLCITWRYPILCTW